MTRKEENREAKRSSITELIKNLEARRKRAETITKYRTTRPLLRVFNSSLYDLATPNNLSIW